MHIQNIIEQHRRDFTAILKCEHCNGTQKLSNGYDDNNYHQNVIPSIKCSSCGCTASDDYTPLVPKYNEGQIV